MLDVVKAKESLSKLPMPKRGEILWQLGDELRKIKIPLGKLISLEVGKIVSEGTSEV